MTLWALVFGMSLMTATGKLDMGATVEQVFKTKAECEDVKKRLDEGSKKAVDNGEVDRLVNSFGAVCVAVPLDIHNKPAIIGG